MKVFEDNMSYIWQNKNWSHFYWDSEKLIDLLANARRKQGLVRRKGDLLKLNDISHFLSEEAVTTSEIEGEKLDKTWVRSSVARRLGLPTAGHPEIRREPDSILILANKKKDDRVNRPPKGSMNTY